MKTKVARARIQKKKKLIGAIDAIANNNPGVTGVLLYSWPVHWVGSCSRLQNLSDGGVQARMQVGLDYTLLLTGRLVPLQWEDNAPATHRGGVLFLGANHKHPRGCSEKGDSASESK